MTLTSKSIVANFCLYLKAQETLKGKKTIVFFLMDYM